MDLAAGQQRQQLIATPKQGHEALMETRSNHILVGGVVLGLLAALVGFVVWLAGISGGVTKSYDIFFQQSVEGLSQGGLVTYAGVPSGEVKHIELWRDNPGFVRVRIEVKRETPVLQGTTASLQGSFTGPSSILLDGAVKGAPAITDVGPAGAPVIPTKRTGLGALLNNAPQLLERISTLTERVTELLNDKNQKSLSGILANTDRLTATLARNGPQIEATLAETRTTIKQAGLAAEQLTKLADTTNGLLDSEGRPMVVELRKTAAAAQKSLTSLDAALVDARPGLQALSNQTIPEVGRLVRDLRVMSEALGSVATKLDQGGAGALLGAPQLPDYKPGRQGK
jgi:phospholipid/cholesterol/gamma-HCH transport system substrate-binding protein